MGRVDKQGIAARVGDHVVHITSPDKQLWPLKGVTKRDYLQYLIQISGRLLPFLKNRALTVIRFPDGVDKESFFQKNCPDYAPSFVKSHEMEGIRYVVCNDLETLLWLGNQASVEFHVPFQTVDTVKPKEICLDLDPPSRKEFSLAVHAAKILEAILGSLGLQSFVKTSGNKGIQVYIPLRENTYTYEETRVFTDFLAAYLIQQEPQWFTTERMKRNRGNKLYLDIVQHSSGKTIIAPYSMRGNDEALVATPLQWKEVKEQVRPEQFPMERVLERVENEKCPFASFFETKNDKFKDILEWLQSEYKRNK